MQEPDAVQEPVKPSQPEHGTHSLDESAEDADYMPSQEDDQPVSSVGD